VPRKWLLIPPTLLALWVMADLALPHRSSLVDFDGHKVGRLETEMWLSYYGHQPARLYLQLVELLRSQYHLPFWRACLAAYHAAHAAVVFQRGHDTAEYDKALPDLVDYYTTIRRSSDIAFSGESAARLELTWWIVHRERARHPAGDLEQSLATLQAAIYRRPENLFRDHAQARAAAMSLRDAAAEQGGVTEQQWNQIASLLDHSWVSLQKAVARAHCEGSHSRSRPLGSAGKTGAD
jgi:hypothetical protein